MTTKISLLGARLDLELRQGTTFRRTLNIQARQPDGETLEPVDLTGCQVRGQVRKAALDATKVADFTVTVLDAAQGRVQLLLTDEVTAAFTCGPKISDPASLYEYDVEVQDSAGDVVPILQGSLRIKAEVTR